MKLSPMTCCLCGEEALAVATDHSNRKFFTCSNCGEYEVSNSAGSELERNGDSHRLLTIQEWIKETPDDQLLSVSFDAPKRELVFEREPRKRL
ncbi:hypothetical protein [Aeromonas eucrenophila]|uniref:Uncharacterized protein n=1 Tax=Aeromonas eucrenophila TaxID=649 RepID=A0ABW0YCW9_9GAMM|nr:hypothetical protein [Aeromonas eucrenophila]